MPFSGSSRSARRMFRGRPSRSRRDRAFASPAAHAESFRVLRTNLDVRLAGIAHPSVIVTSASAGEGKTSTTVDLARSLALAGRRIVLVDLDLRHPDTHNHLQVSNDLGVCEVLQETHRLADCLQFVPVQSENKAKADGLYFLPTGGPVPDPAELLDGIRTGVLIDTLARQADLLLIDTPPILPVADTLIIGRRVSGAILVVETRTTAFGAVERAKSALSQNETTVFGIVVNKLQARDARQTSGYGYTYGYGYGKGRPPERPELDQVAASDRPVAFGGSDQGPTARPSTTQQNGSNGADHDVGRTDATSL